MAKQPSYPVKELRSYVRESDNILCYHPICVKPKEVFIEQARAIWGDRYDYTDSVYTNNKEPITIRCRKHDHYFTVAMAQNHLMKHNATGCPVCSYEQQYGEHFGTDWRKYLEPTPGQNRVRRIYQPKTNNKHRSPEEIAAEKAERDRQREEAKAQRWQAYQARLQQQKEETRRRHEAERTARQQAREQQERQRIQDLQDRVRREGPLMQGDGYIYKGIEQVTSKRSTVMVHCGNPDHKWHRMLVSLVLQGCKCRECAGRHQSVEERKANLLERVKEKFGDGRFLIAIDEYTTTHNPITVTCLDHNYTYKIAPDILLNGAGGCPYCTASEGEAVIKGWLENHNIPHLWHAQIPNEDPTLPLQYVEPDFWLEHLNLYIEYHGQQHYEDVKYFYKGKKIRSFAVQQHRDRYLRDYCQRHGHSLLEIPYWDFQRIGEILTNELLNH